MGLLLGVASLRVWLYREMSSSRKPKKDPSQVAKDRITSILEQDVEECGKIARYVRQHSNSKDVIEQNMTNTTICVYHSLGITKSCQKNCITRTFNG